MTASPGTLAPSEELAERLQRVEAALAADDLATADVHMTAAADLCRRLQAAGLGVPEGELASLREVAARCGAALARAGKELDEESRRDENLRRGITSYHATLTR